MRLPPMPRLHLRIRPSKGKRTLLVLLLLLAVLPLLTQAFDQRYLLSVGTRIVIWSIAAMASSRV